MLTAPNVGMEKQRGISIHVYRYALLALLHPPPLLSGELAVSMASHHCLQGRTNESELTGLGKLQALQCQAALSNMHFDR